MVETFFTIAVTPFLWIAVSSYAAFTIILTVFWGKIPSFADKKKASCKASVTVIIPVRNEESNIGNLLQDLDKQSLPHSQFEVFVIDDSSTDRTAALVQKLAGELSCTIRLIVLSNELTTSPKKRAIETALLKSTAELIVTTDGDCRVGTNWLEAYLDCYASTGAKFISGPVTFTREVSMTDHLQTVEFSSLIGSGASAISAGFPSLCNGANLAYQREMFHDVNGYDGVRHIASGDDEFLMHKIAARYPGTIHFLKDARAIVQTQAHQKWQLFFLQRKRWASKWKHYQSKTPLALALYVFVCNFSLIAGLLLCIFGPLPVQSLLWLWLIKCIPEWIFIGSILGFLQKKRSLFYIPVTQLIYPFYVCFFGFAAQSSEYMWKGRKLK